MITVLHDGVANMSWMFFLALGLWGLLRAIRGQGVDGSYLGAAAIGQGLYIVQGILGLLLVFFFDVTFLRPGIYVLYLIFVMIFLPFIYFAVLQGDDSNRGQWVLTFASLFLFGVSLRLIGLVNETL